VSVIVELSIFPLGAPGGLSGPVSRALEVIRASGLPHQLTPMGTCIEGDYDQVMAVVGQCFHALEPDFERLYMTVKADWRRGREGGLDQKTRSVRDRLET